MLKYGHLFNDDRKILIFQARWYENKIVFRVNPNQRCFNVEIYQQINVDKSTLNQRGYHVDRRPDVISTYINVKSTLSPCWVFTLFFGVTSAFYRTPTWVFIELEIEHNACRWASHENCYFIVTYAAFKITF